MKFLGFFNRVLLATVAKPCMKHAVVGIRRSQGRGRMGHLVGGLLLLGVSIAPYATANTISSITFTYTPNGLNVNPATDFTLSTGGTKILQAPNSVPFTANDWAPPGNVQPKVNFTGGNVAAGGQATFVITTKFPNPGACGYFTGKVMGNDVQVSNQVCGNVVQIAPLPRPPAVGNNGPFVLENNSGGTLMGSLSVYVDNGLSSDFDETDFETLDSPQLIYSASNLDLANGQGVTIPSFNLTQDQYLLIEGSFSGNGVGPEPFATAISPVPEPGMLPLVGVAMACLAAAKMRKRDNRQDDAGVELLQL